MFFYEELIRECSKFEKVYDLVAYCYDYLIETVKNQAFFISNYIWENDNAKQNNPNLELTRNMQYDLKTKILEQDERGLSIADNIEELCDLIGQYENMLVDYGEDEKLNHAVIPFFIIRGIELYVMDHDIVYRSAPLNQKYQGKSFVYLNEPCGIMEEISEIANYAQVIKRNEIRNEIESFVFLEKRELGDIFSAPHMVTLNKNKEYLEQLCQNRILKIAVIPFGNENMLEFPMEKGASFRVVYTDCYRDNAKEKALKLLCRAIENGANIIVFPEYVCSPDLQEAISQKLQEIYFSLPEKLNELLFVVAGSGWTQDSNNVSKIYSYNGSFIGEQYKYSSYSNRKSGNGHWLMERLMNPGKVTTILKVPKIGNVQVGICRDISEMSYSHQLTRIFSPAFLLIPAWSSSVNIAFKTQLKSIVSENHTTSAVVCNCCEAFPDGDSFKEQLSIIVIPDKKGTVIEGQDICLFRHKKECVECSKHGCVYMCKFDFSAGDYKKEIIVELLQLFCE